tara:strand:+ start:153 stop:320 length:168 start_codon:yes stop_codon:yes gene_type:complete
VTNLNKTFSYYWVDGVFKKINYFIGCETNLTYVALAIEWALMKFKADISDAKYHI